MLSIRKQVQKASPRASLLADWVEWASGEEGVLAGTLWLPDGDRVVVSPRLGHTGRGEELGPLCVPQPHRGQGRVCGLDPNVSPCWGWW